MDPNFQRDIQVGSGSWFHEKLDVTRCRSSLPVSFQVDQQRFPVLLTEPPYNPTAKREKMVEAALKGDETFKTMGGDEWFREVFL